MELVFQDVKQFDAQNSIIVFLMKEADIDKEKDLSKFLNKVPEIGDLEIQSRLKKLHEKNEFFNRGNGGSSNNFFLPPPSPPPTLPDFSNPRPPPPFSDLFNISNVQRVDEFLNNNGFNFEFFNGYVPPAVVVTTQEICKKFSPKQTINS